jgi:hypothetical protein
VATNAFCRYGINAIINEASAAKKRASGVAAQLAPV